MSNNDVILSQIRQRLEILYQMVEELEREGGGGGGGGGTTNYNQLSNKPSIEGQQLIGNKTAAQLGLATSSQLNRKVDKETGKGLSTNDFTNTDVANLATALQKANAAAPQATTYTKTEVNTALEDKINIMDVFGVGETIPTSSDLNNYTTPGIYRCSLSSIAQTLSNCPTTQGFKLEVRTTTAENRLNQVLYANATIPEIYYRTYTTNGWSSWYKLDMTVVQTGS